ncbi:MAG TPA: aromatic ring-hydroxylating dioxygenase subunit alpha [Steroidobacteraceae bacterium]|nr:aromatic ring-hydroxylating dioxygenase subunit alpha [Steroidobacteraceae bacterium]
MTRGDDSVLAAELKPALPARFYQDAALFRLEAERIFFEQWFCVGRAEQIPAPGDCLHVAVAGESVLILRGRDGALRAFYNVCRHRGSQLIRSPALPDVALPDAMSSGRLSGAVTCPYHAWSYNFDGTLRAAPFMRFDETCPKDGFSLAAIHLDTWGGFIFLNLTRQAAPSPLAEQLSEPTRRLVRYPLQDLRRGAHLVYDVRANWKVLMENYNECYHCGPVHPELCALVPAFRERGGAGLNWEDGIPHRPGAWTFTMTGTSTRAPFPGLSDAEKTHHKGEVCYPNLLLSAAAEHVAAFTLWPKSAELTRISCEFLFHHAQTTRPGFDPRDVVEFWDLVNRQDWQICEGVQEGMRSRGFRGAFYAPMEDPSLDIRRYLEKHLGDLTRLS